MVGNGKGKIMNEELCIDEGCPHHGTVHVCVSHTPSKKEIIKMNEDIERQQVNPWIPMKKAIDIKHIGKLLEELNECGTALARCLIQGIDECETNTGKSNRLWLEQEIADVLANCELIIIHFELNYSYISERKISKIIKLRQWHKMLEE